MELRNLNLKFGTWNLKFWNLEFWKLRLGILIMKSEVWFFENIRFEFRIWALRMWNWKFGNEKFELKIWILKDTWKLWKRFFFFLVDWVNSIWLSWLSFWLSLSVGAEILAPHFFISLLAFFGFIFHQLLFLHWHYSPSSSSWFFFFISPFLLTQNTFLSFSTFPHPFPSIFL